MGNPSQEIHDLKEGERRFFLTGIYCEKIVTWKCHVDESTNGRYNMILGRDLLTALVMDLKFY